MPKSVFEWWRELPVYNTLGCHSDFKKRDAWTTLVTTSRYLFHQDPGNMIHGISMYIVLTNVDTRDDANEEAR